jgi:putative two-component system response regulator
MQPYAKHTHSHFGMVEMFHQKRGPRILVVDDNHESLIAMRGLLQSHGYRAITVASAEEAEREVARYPPDVILLDVMLPGKSGYELCHELKTNPATRLIPVIIVTGLSDRDSRLRGINAGADDFLNKPTYPEELFARVNSLVRLKQFTDELDHAGAVLCSLGLSVESRDPYTEGHCERLARYASDLGRQLGLDEESIVALKRGGFLHDLGKVAIPDEILKKGSNLSAAERKVMKRHPVIGERICKPLKSLRRVLPIIRHHHEHWNGSGYPDGLAGEEIPLLARVLQVVDVYDALRTARPYKRGLSHDQAINVMKEEADRGLWDPNIVREFISISEKRKIAA